MLMPRYRGIVLTYKPYSSATAKRYNALGGGVVRIQDANTEFRRMKMRSRIPLASGDTVFFDDIDDMAQNIVKEGKRRSRTLLYK